MSIAKIAGSILFVVSVYIACDSPRPVPDDAQAQDSKISLDRPAREATTGDLPRRDLLLKEARPPDGPPGTAEYSRPCCVKKSATCLYDQCKVGLTCFVFPGGPYFEQGVCTVACDPEICPDTPLGNVVCYDGHCIYRCPPPPSGCDASSCFGCPSGLNCRTIMGGGFCMP